MNEHARTCRTCHEVHDAKRENRVRDSVRYGNSGWRLKIDFTKTATAGRLQIRVHPAVAVADAKGVLHAIEPYREVDFTDVLQARIRFLLGEIDQAALDRAIDPESSPLPDSDPVKRAMRDVKMARTLVELGQPEAAVKRAQKALEQAPVAAAFPVLGLAYARLGRCAEAKKMLDQAQKVAPDSPDIAQARSLCAGK